MSPRTPRKGRPGVDFRAFAGLSYPLPMRRLWVLPLFGLFLAPAPAHAEEWPAAIKGLKVVIPEAKGKKADGKSQLSGALRRTMTEAVGPLVPSRALEKAQKNLKQKNTFEAAALAAAGKEAGAQYVLAVEITKKKWLYTAQALLINTETGQVQMDFRSQFYKPGAEAGDRGTRIAKRAIEKLAELGASGGTSTGPVAQQDPPPSGLDEKLDDPPPPVTDEKLPDEPPPEAPPPPVEEPPPPVVAENDPPPPPPVELPPPPPPAVAPPPSNNSANTTQTVVTPINPADEPELFRFSITAGSGLLRTYGLSSAAVDTSNLSFSMKPSGLFAADAELVAPGVPIAVALRGAFRPIRYETSILGSVSNPSGSLLDVSGMFGFHVTLAGTGRTRYKLIPAVGARLSMANVAEHPGNTVLGSTALATVGGLGLRLPFNDVLEVSFAVDGGLILSYSERPFTTGSSGAGFTIGGDLGARIWISDSVAIAFDNRFNLDRVTFEGSPTRQLPEDETGQLSNASVSIRDLRSSIGIALRL